MDTKSRVDLAEAYAAHKGPKVSTVATDAAMDGKFFKSLSAGAGCTLRKAATVIAWFSANWPADLQWPPHISRPPKRKKEAA